MYRCLSPSRSLPVTLLFLSQSLDELDDDDAGERERREEEEELVQANTFQNEAMTADPAISHLLVRSDMTGGRRRQPLCGQFSLCFFQALRYISLTFQDNEGNRGSAAQVDTQRALKLSLCFKEKKNKKTCKWQKIQRCLCISSI